jgi:hypothetical protein
MSSPLPPPSPTEKPEPRVKSTPAEQPRPATDKFAQKPTNPPPPSPGTAPGPVEQPRSQQTHGETSVNASPAAGTLRPLSPAVGPATENRTYGGLFKKEVYTVEVVENVDTPLVVLALGQELLVGGPATFRIVGTNYGMFHVGETSGDLVLNTSPDREERDNYVLRIKVAPPTLSPYISSMCPNP